MPSPTLRPLAFLLLVAATARGHAPPLPDFTSPHMTPVTGTIHEALLRSNSDPVDYQGEIEAQLFFLVGTMFRHRAAADLGHAVVRILSVAPSETPGFKDVRYSASFVVGWDKRSAVPVSIPTVFPLQADTDGKAAFFEKYGKVCSEDGSEPDLNAVSFYYYFRPEKEGCPLFRRERPELAGFAALQLERNYSSPAGKYPEYGKVWEDGRLVVTAMFGTNVAGSTSFTDPGIMAYNDMYRRLRRRFGAPDKSNVSLPFLSSPGAQHPDVEMEWKLSEDRSVNVDILLIDKEELQHPSERFAARYNDRTKTSDLVAYGGHSGFGDNIRGLAKLGNFVAGQYQIYFIDGCDTYFYVDDSLRAAHAAVNPGSTPWKYFDIITNGLPGYFASNAPNDMALIEALLGTTKTYEALLSDLDERQRPIVTGEEDNRWPEPFNP